MRERGWGKLRTWRPHILSRPDLAQARLRASNSWQDLAVSTPGRLAAVGLVLILLVLGSGVLAGSTANDRQARITALRQHSEPLANAAQDLFSSLSVADASAGTAFLAGGLQPVALLERQNEAIGTATAALSSATIGVDPADADAHRLLAVVGSQIPIYTALIATANANNRVGNPVGVSYLNEASHLMQGTILPQAQKLYSDQTAAVARLDKRNSTLEWAPIALTAITLVALVYFQIRIARQSRRVLNFGLLPATLAMGVLLTWLLIAGGVSSSYSHRALVEGSQPLSALTSARILAQQARTDETLNLLQRDSSFEMTTAFDDHLDEIGALLEEGPSITTTAPARLDGWRQAHQVMQSKLAAGDYAGAVATTISVESASSGSQFTALDEDLAQQIDQLRGNGQSAVSSSYNALTLLAVGSGVLSVAAALLILLGLWPRLSEYQ